MPERDEAEALAQVIASVTDLWDEPLDSVHDIPPIVNAILASPWLDDLTRLAADTTEGGK